MDCLVWEGLGNRFNAIASSMVISKDIDLYWSVNKHLPVNFQQIFKPIEGINVKNIHAERFGYSQLVGRICHYYVCNPGRLDINDFSKEILQKYRLLFDSILDKHTAKIKLPTTSVGIHYRSFLEESRPVEEFLYRGLNWINQKPIKPEVVFISSDNVKYTKFLQSKIPNAQISPEDMGMQDDLDRVSSFGDWLKSLSIFRQCYGGIYSSCARSTAFDVMRGYGIITDFDESDKHDRNNLIEEEIKKEVSMYAKETTRGF